jgi:hypothetical protein
MDVFSSDYIPRTLVRHDTCIEKGGLGFSILGTNVDGNLLTALAKSGEQFVTFEQLHSTPNMLYALHESAVILSLLLDHGKNRYKIPLSDFLEMYNGLLSNPYNQKEAHKIQSWLKEKIPSDVMY